MAMLLVFSRSCLRSEFTMEEEKVLECWVRMSPRRTVQPVLHSTADLRPAGNQAHSINYG